VMWNRQKDFIILTSSPVVRASDYQCQSCNSPVLSSIPTSSDTVEFEGRQMKQLGLECVDCISKLF
jgi:hypothetical protein